MTNEEALNLVNKMIDHGSMNIEDKTDSIHSYGFWYAVREALEATIWHNALDDEPPKNIPLLCKGKNGGVFIANYDYTDKIKHRCIGKNCGNCASREITEWMEVPR